MAMAAGSTMALPQDIGSCYLPYIFPPHTGNDLDWSFKASDDLQFDGVEFGSLPSGLHLIEQDVLYVSFPLPLTLFGIGTSRGTTGAACAFYPAPDIQARPARLPSLLPRHPPRAFPAPAPLAPHSRTQSSRARSPLQLRRPGR
ncbi:hypothetical protein EDB89DRAFT_995010 [Lactarius sanguifluus]|nr:hypothetical protein EDB89DRAFT_995010 [Lactarius sanguifluus]